MKFIRFVLLFAIALTLLSESAIAADQVIALKAARLFDGKSHSLIQNGVVLIQGDKIVDAGANITIPSDAQAIDLGDATLSPGLMDAHTHLTHDLTDYRKERMDQIDLNVSEHALRASVHARNTLEAGFTTVRDVGSRFPGSKEFVDVALRNAINKGFVLGPRMLVATYGIGATGGHFDPTGGFRDMLFGHEPDYSE